MSDKDKRIEKAEIEAAADDNPFVITDAEDLIVPENLAQRIVAARGGGGEIPSVEAVAAERQEYANMHSLRSRVIDARTRIWNPTPEERAANQARIAANASGGRVASISADVPTDEISMPHIPSPPPAVELPDVPGQARAAIRRAAALVPSERDQVWLAEAKAMRRKKARRDHDPYDLV